MNIGDCAKIIDGRDADRECRVERIEGEWCYVMMLDEDLPDQYMMSNLEVIDCYEDDEEQL